MLNKLFTNILLSYLYIGIALLVLFSLVISDCDIVVLMSSMFYLITFVGITYYYNKVDDSFFNNKRVFFLVFIYSLLFVYIYYNISLYRNNDIMVFCYSDASLYLKETEKLSGMNFSDIFEYLKRWKYDDWGAFAYASIFYKIIPSKIFINLTYIFWGSISSVCLFDIGARIMPPKNAFICAISFGCSSFWIFYHSSFLKETIFVSLVIYGMYFFYRYIYNKKKIDLFLSIIIPLLLIFYRPAVLVFLFGSYLSYWIIESKKSAAWLVGFIFGCLLLFALTPIVYSIYINYTHGDVTTVKTYIGVTRFSWATNCVAALIGPFPNLMDKVNEISYRHLYGPSLLLKYMLFVPFWAGCLYVIKYRLGKLLPLVMFCLFEILSIVIINNGLVLRKSLPHIPFFYLCSFWYLSVMEDDNNQRVIRLMKKSWVLVFVSTLIWNLFK